MVQKFEKLTLKKNIADQHPNLFTIRLHHGGVLTDSPCRAYKWGTIDFVDYVDTDMLSMHEISDMVELLGYSVVDHIYYYFQHPEKNLDDGLLDLSSDQDVLNLARHVEKHKIINVYSIHGVENIKQVMLSMSPIKVKQRKITIEEIDEPGPYAIVPAKLKVVRNLGAGQCSETGGESSGVGQHEMEGVECTKVGQSSVTSLEVGEDIFLDDNGPLPNEEDEAVDVVGGDEELVDEEVHDGHDCGENNMMPDHDGNDKEDSDSEYIVDENNVMADHEVDMSDYRMHVDVDVEDEGLQNDDWDVDDEGLQNDAFPSGSESDDNETSLRRKQLNKLRKAKASENRVVFYLSQVFGTKEEAKHLIKTYSVESRRQIVIIKDDKERLRAECHGCLPEFDVDDFGVHIASQASSQAKGKGPAAKGKGSVVKKSN